MSLLHVLFNNEFELILNPADTSYPPVSYLGFLNYKISYTLLYLAVFGLKNGGQGASCKDDFALYFVFWMSQFFIYATKFIIVCRTVWGWIWDVSNSVQQKGFKQKVITQAIEVSMGSTETWFFPVYCLFCLKKQILIFLFDSYHCATLWLVLGFTAQKYFAFKK